ncbi:phosphatidate cytidylyltransferase [Conexibacter stalactiti]|uniref:Phosphatidate cytidylyltransferase n=1 Tax=Conexibacter stalactiti TaxID=1940611 RepID=A0ABU4HTR2_9ACTN|nr:phosphatidate cytidylyltransferase [Conexibacter stalactiti]MDW5596703.1 phosphatidate cytidylyltransferase [Conexibacter stalactiti]MEC5037345.1 phosphatidate cytidylyltransferase [Conexibacter stalactiti]
MSSGGDGEFFDVLADDDDGLARSRARRAQAAEESSTGGRRGRGGRRGGRGGGRRGRRRGGPGVTGGDVPRKPGSDLPGRVAVAVPAAIAVIAVNAFGGPIWAAALLAVGILAMHELYEMLRPVQPVAVAGFIALAGMLAAALYGTQFHILLAAVSIVPVLFVLTALGPEREHASLAMATTILGIYWIGFALAHAVLLRELPHGNAIVIDVLVGTFIGDTGAYFGGRMFGRRKLAPRISPNKTVEGLVIGMLAAVAAVFCAGLYQDWLSTTEALLLGVGVAIAAPIGDLFESFIKRDVGTKDTGRAFGAHGGALDRIDAALFAAVVGYYIWYALA